MILKNFKQKNGGFTRTPKFGVTPKGGGFTLIETLVAISIFSISILAMMAVLADGISDTNYAKTKITASYLAQEGIEYIRNMRDNYVLYTDTTGLTWDDFKAANKDYPSPDPNFIRTITQTTVSGDPELENEVRIRSTVSWTQGSGNYSVVFSESLFNWVE